VHSFDLVGRRAVVTGAAEGFGRAIAERFLASGASVSLWDRDSERLATTARELAGRGAVHTATMDVSSLAEVEAATAATLGSFSGIDILVANAGIAGPNHTTWEYPVDEWRRVVDVDLLGVYYCCRAVVPIMIEQRNGRIVTIPGNAASRRNPPVHVLLVALRSVHRGDLQRREDGHHPSLLHCQPNHARRL
jgi:NAD(P)-dependent dehydrogenase (short-subunit alcohol dehydrogenase family)